MSRRNWTREELIVAFNLYCKMRFGQLHRGNRQIISLANVLGRTPSAVAMKLCNFAAFDPSHQRRGISGLSNASRADEGIWNEFNSNWNELATQSERAFRELRGAGTALHDRAFDRGLISVDSRYQVAISTQIDQHLPHRVIDDMFARFRGSPIQLPEKFGSSGLCVQGAAPVSSLWIF